MECWPRTEGHFKQWGITILHTEVALAALSQVLLWAEKWGVPCLHSARHMLGLLQVLPVAPWGPHRRQWNPTPQSWPRSQVQAVQVIFSNLIYQTINKWAQNISIFLLQLGLAFNWKDGLPQAHDMGFLPEIGLARQSGSLNLHRFDSRKVVSWITCLSSFCIPAIFPGSHKWQLQSHWEALACWTLSPQPGRSCCCSTQVCQRCSTATRAPLQLLAGQILMGLLLSEGTVLSHWPAVGICPGVWTANSLGPMCCTDMQIWV